MSISQNSSLPAFQIRPEMRILFSIARANLSLSDRENLTALLHQEIDWKMIIDAAVKHGLWPLLNHHLESVEPDLVRADLRDTLREAYRDHVSDARTHVRDLHGLLAAFHEAGLDPIPYKGPILGQRLYGHYALRLFGDLDFLVRPEEAHRAYECLIQQGYHPETRVPQGWEKWYITYRHAHEFYHPINRLFVELHWAPWQRFLSMPVDIHSCWEHRERICLEGQEVPSLAMENLLFLLCLHGIKHQWCRLAWLVDVAEIIRSTPALDWARIWSLVNHSHSGTFHNIGLWLAYRLLDAPLPLGVVERIQVDKQVLRLADEIGEKLSDCVLHTPTRNEALSYNIRVISNYRTRFRFLWGVATEPCRDDWDYCLLPSSLSSLYAFIRPWRLLKRLCNQAITQHS